jgi:hypothetical protein
MCLRRAPEKYITGAALDRAALVYKRGESQGFLWRGVLIFLPSLVCLFVFFPLCH